MEWLRSIVDPDLFMPHGHCYLWQPGMVALQVGSNALIGTAYVSITLTLLYLVRRITDIPFRLMYLAFGVFIIACGTTHFFDIVTVWTPLYWVDGIIRAITAVASVGTAVMLPPLVPKALELARAARSAHERGEELKIAHASLGTMYEQARRDAEEAMRDSAAWMQLLAETIPQIVWTAKADGKRDYVNARWTGYTGLPAEASGEDGWLGVVHPDDAPLVTQRWRASIGSLQPFECEYRLRRADGQYRWHLARALPLLDRDGKVRRWFATATDIDDQKRAIAALETAVQLRDDFLSVASHELRTPLTALKLNADLLAARGAAAAPRVAGNVVRHTNRLARLVDQLLDVSRLTAGPLELSREPADLGAIATEVVEDERQTAEAAGTPLELHVESPAPGVWDVPRIERVLGNLIANALRYGQRKPIHVTVRGAGGEAVLEVRDEGIGIAKADHERIFGRFERASPIRNYGGLGLGLWISRRIAEAHGGTLTVESEPGQGAKFTLRLPR